jgi:hypothetical protein
VTVIDPPSGPAKLRPSDVRTARVRRPSRTNTVEPPCAPLGLAAGPPLRKGRALGRPRFHPLPRTTPLLLGLGDHQASTQPSDQAIMADSGAGGREASRPDGRASTTGVAFAGPGILPYILSQRQGATVKVQKR